MSDLQVIADDVTGACDVGGEFAAAGYAVRVAVDGRTAAARAGELTVWNTQSRALPAGEAAARVRAAIGRAPTAVLLKKIDTALRGHLGAELAAAVEASGAGAAFVIPALPAAGRTTRDGRQWVAGRLLGTTEFARDPEGRGAESSVDAVLAYECSWPSAVVDVGSVRAGKLEVRARALLDDGRRLIVVDAETDADVECAVASVLALPRPICLAGSVPVAGALARRSEVGAGRPHAVAQGALRAPTLIVCGSLHSRAHAQTAALVAHGLADRVALDARGLDALATQVRVSLDRGRGVVLEAPAIAGAPDAAAMRAVEARLGEVVSRVAAAGPIGSLVLIGGETSYAVLRRLAATELLVRARPSALVAVAEIATGIGAGMSLVAKGGSGGDVEALTALVTHATAG